MEINFSNLKTETIKALVADSGLPKELLIPLNNLLKQKGKGGPGVELSFGEFVNRKLASASQQ